MKLIEGRKHLLGYLIVCNVLILLLHWQRKSFCVQNKYNSVSFENEKRHRRRAPLPKIRLNQNLNGMKGAKALPQHLLDKYKRTCEPFSKARRGHSIKQTAADFVVGDE